ncbi:MAG: hypothetical protein IKW76_01330, partial [Clostridia bacterium]|nr:hypothetical protein [Clostridia bacterium]
HDASQKEKNTPLADSARAVLTDSFPRSKAPAHGKPRAENDRSSDSCKKQIHHEKLGDRANKKYCHCEALMGLRQSQPDAGKKQHLNRHLWKIAASLRSSR